MNLEKYIDHTNLKAYATKKDIEKLCKEALEYNFASVCINPYWVPYASELLKDSDVKVCTVIGFPLGATSSASKASETTIAIQQGASEVDMVINIGSLKEGNFDEVYLDIKAVVEAAKKSSSNVIVKVILETCYLTDDEIIEACNCCVKAGADFVKTSTGFGTAGATIENVKLMKETVKNKCKVKAAGGIRDKETALAMIKAGADRIGTSNGIDIIK